MAPLSYLRMNTIGELEAYETAVLSEHDVPLLPAPSFEGPTLVQQQEPGRNSVTGILLSRYDRHINKLKSEIVNLKREGADIQAEIDSMACQTSAEGSETFKMSQEELLAEIQLTRDKLDTCLKKNRELEGLHAELVRANEELLNALEASRRAWRRS